MLASIKKQISGDIDLVSFDIFDTLIVRMVYYPSDIFYLIEYSLQQMINSNDVYPFHDMRILAEEEAREYSCEEEISLSDIYAQLRRISTIPPHILEKAHEREIYLENKLCRRRESIYEVYWYCKSCGKKTIFISDMYLDKEIIKKMLHNAGYDEDDEIFLSSEYKLTKSSGNLYDLAYKGYDKKRIVHIGDNYYSDYQMAKKKGVRAIWIKKQTDNLDKFIRKRFSQSQHMLISHASFLGLRSALALIAYRFFDTTPTPPTNTPEFIGYVYLGLHLYTLAKWLIQHAKGRDRLVFCARDGYLPMKATKIVRDALGSSIPIKYMLVSRTAFLPFFFYGNHYEVISNQFSFNHITPSNILSSISPFLNPSYKIDKEITEKEYFSSMKDMVFYFYILSKYIDNEKLDEHVSQCKKYFDHFMSSNASLFDIGYSLRTETILHKLYNYDIESLSLHYINDIVFRRENSASISHHSFYDFTPRHTGGLRELLLSKNSASCTAYKATSKFIKVQFNPNSMITDNTIIDRIQKNALQFVEDFCQSFSKDIEFMNIRSMDGSFLFEAFMNSRNPRNFNIFKNSYFEDVLSSNSKMMSLYSLCLNSIDNLGPAQKAWHYFLNNREIFYHKINERLTKYLRRLGV